MSAKSRGRHRFLPPEPVDEMAAAAEEYAAEQQSAWVKANADADKKRGLATMVQQVLDDRTHALAKPDTPPAPEPAEFDHDAVGLRQPTAYEAATLSALGNRAVFGAEMYGGTVEPWRVADRRRRNRVARASRRANRGQR